MLAGQYLFVADGKAEIEVLAIAECLEDRRRRFFRRPGVVETASERRDLRPDVFIDFAVNGNGITALHHVVLRHAVIRADHRGVRRPSGTAAEQGGGKQVTVVRIHAVLLVRDGMVPQTGQQVDYRTLGAGG